MKVNAGEKSGLQMMLIYDVGVKYIPRSSGSNIGSTSSA